MFCEYGEKFVLSYFEDAQNAILSSDLTFTQSGVPALANPLYIFRCIHSKGTIYYVCMIFVCRAFPVSI